jgi:hypothetical protein
MDQSTSRRLTPCTPNAQHAWCNVSDSPTVERALEGFPTAYRQDIEDDVNRFRDVIPRRADSDGEAEILLGLKMTHYFVQAPGERGGDWLALC